MSFALNAVYNNYLSTYTPKAVTRYDTHKKSELRSVYNSMVKLNKESPWYLPTKDKETQGYAVDLKENARELHNTMAELGALEEQGLFNRKNAYSSNENVATATFVGTMENAEADPSFSLEVKKLATPQQNMGDFLNDEPVALREGTYSFDVAINDMNYEFQFAISADETNKAVQERLMRLMNNSGIGITADIREHEGQTSLVLTSESTGLPGNKPVIFSVSDEKTSKMQGAVEYFGLDYVSKRPQNAEFTLNGEDRTSASNHFTVGKMFELELLSTGTEGESVQIGLKTDVESLADNISHMIGGYNSFIQTANNYLETQSRSKLLVGEMKNIAGVFGEEMGSTGINMEEDGSLSIDKNALYNVAENSEDLNETFAYLKAFSGALLRKSNQISLNPMNYVEKTVVAYKNPGHNFVSPYNTGSYTGMMFNSYC